MSRTVIAGCGIAGTTAACALKEMLPEEEIILMDKTGCGLYSRIRLPEVLSGKLPEAKLLLTTPEMLKEKGIRTIFNAEITSLDPQEKTVEYNGGSLQYDRFVFALGAAPLIPAIPGLERSMGLRDLEDLHRIESMVCGAERALVIGGGLLGLEIADSVSEKGVAVTVSEIGERLLPAILNQDESEFLFDYLTERGLRIVLSGKVEGICRDGDSYRVVLNGKDEVFDLILVSAGILPEVSIARSAGLKVNRGICINDRFETSADGVYAIGDCAELEGRVYGLWMASKSQGTALASILAGKADSYQSPVFSPVPKLPGISLKLLKEKAAAK